ncbi:hypothetical protein [Nocardioides sp. W7]|uniref:hypothetical protein n=1 Tax=Nocardioides sp. W7 TaxID=2931390 RepID=UPI001FD0D691|nr:hypothetical protein [Nocardioides sp. W7]
MHLRTVLTLSAAVLAASVMTLGSTIAQATTPHGPIAGVEVNGSKTTGAVPVHSSYKSGTTTFAGVTIGCLSGGMSGVVNRGPNAAGPHFVFDELDLTCDSPLGEDVVVSLKDTAACNINTIMAHATVHDTIAVDTDALGGDPSRVPGTATVPSKCVEVTNLSGCRYQVDGTIAIEFDEAIKTTGGVRSQNIHLNGNNLRTRNPNFFCFGLISNGGVITLNNIIMNLRVTAGTDAVRGINIYN